jgi:hypothetical protein
LVHGLLIRLRCRRRQVPQERERKSDNSSHLTPPF